MRECAAALGSLPGLLARGGGFAWPWPGPEATEPRPMADDMFHLTEKNGGRSRARTVDPLIKSQLLYQLS